MAGLGGCHDKKLKEQAMINSTKWYSKIENNFIVS